MVHNMAFAMRPRSVKTRNTLMVVIVSMLAFALEARPKQPDPVPYHGAPIIPWAKKIKQHRFRSPRTYNDTIKYYDLIFWKNRYIKKIKIVNTSTKRAVHYKNTRTGASWEGLNIYELNGSGWIYVVFSKDQLERINAKQNRKKTRYIKKPKRKQR